MLHVVPRCGTSFRAVSRKDPFSWHLCLYRIAYCDILTSETVCANGHQEEESMSILFEPTEINGMKLENRFVRSATWEGMAAPNGACTQRLKRLLVNLAEGGVGLIITGHAYIRSDGQAGPWQLGIDKDERVESLRKMTHSVHRRGGRIAIQIAHGGLFANPMLTGQTPLAPSKLAGLGNSQEREMTSHEIRDIVAAFGQAAHRAKEADFDALQIHAAHGYLLSQFLSPAFNKRRDDYGGSEENRARILLEVLKESRANVGAHFPILVKMNSQDLLDDGLTAEDALRIGYLLQEGGVDAIELSGGTIVGGKFSHCKKDITSEDEEAYFRRGAQDFKKSLHLPIILVGGVRTFRLAERLVINRYADYISMSRPLIREPGLIRRWASGDTRKANCISDSQCRDAAFAGKGIYCVFGAGAVKGKA